MPTIYPGENCRSFEQTPVKSSSDSKTHCDAKLEATELSNSVDSNGESLGPARFLYNHHQQGHTTQYETIRRSTNIGSTLNGNIFSRVIVISAVILSLLTVPVNAALNCASISNADASATPTWLGQCMCVAGYIWNSATGTCDLCSTKTGAAATGSVQGSCACATPATRLWRGSTLTCIALTAINCATSPNNGVDANQAIKTCLCISGYTWNDYFRRCQLDCTTTQYYDTGVKPAGQNSCPCMLGTLWSAATKSCNVNCAGIPFADVPQISTTECPCLYNFVWSSTNATCNIDCGTLPFSTGWVSTTQCTCNAKSTWDAVNYRCNAICTRANYPFSTGSNDTSGGCVCQSRFLWSMTSLSCNLNCPRVTNSTGVLVSQLVCECIPNNSWNSTYGFCVVDCSTMPNGVYSVTYKTCVPNCKAIANVQGTIVQKNPAGWYECSCASGFSWSASTMTCA